MLVMIGVFIIAVMFSGCSVKFTSSDSLQFNLSNPSEKAVSLIAEFEAGESDTVAGDATQQAGSVCTGGACIIY